MRKLSIIILQHNTPGHVTRNLQGLKKATLPPDTEIIVVNNGGNNANEKIEKSAYSGLNIQFFDTPNDGFPAGNNFGLSKTKAQNYAFINPDIIVRPETITKLLQYLEKNPQVGIVSPQLRYADRTVQDNYRVFPSYRFNYQTYAILTSSFFTAHESYLMWDRDPGTNQAVDWVTGAFIIVTGECMKAIGKHDDDHYFLFMSDVVICRDAWERGFETHIVGEVECFHNDARVSSGGIKDVFKKKIIRLHIKDSISYFWHYKFKKTPELAPSISGVKAKERLMRTRQLSGTPTLKNLKGKLQRANPVVSVYKGKIDGNLQYEQPIVFFDTGVVAVVKNKKGEYALIDIWRHTPLQMEKKNTFPVFPDLGNLGIWSPELVRGGAEKDDSKYEESILRELDEEMGVKKEHIEEVQQIGTVIGNTAIDVYKHIVFEVIVNDKFQFAPTTEEEEIRSCRFYTEKEISKLIQENRLVCAITQAALLQSMVR